MRTRAFGEDGECGDRNDVPDASDEIDAAELGSGKSRSGGLDACSLFVNFITGTRGATSGSRRSVAEEEGEDGVGGLLGVRGAPGA